NGPCGPTSVCSRPAGSGPFWQQEAKKAFSIYQCDPFQSAANTQAVRRRVTVVELLNGGTIPQRDCSISSEAAMRARICATYSVEDGISHIVALPNDQAALLSTYHRRVFVVSDSTLKQIDLLPYCTFEAVEPVDRLRAALF